MDNLPREDRDLLSLALAGDLAYADIAALTGLTLSNVKVRIHRARAALHEMLAEGE